MLYQTSPFVCYHVSFNLLYVSNREHYFMTYTYSQTMSNLLVHVVIESSKVVAVPLPYFVNLFY